MSVEQSKLVAEAMEVLGERVCGECKGKGEGIADANPGQGIEGSEPYTEYCEACKGSGKVGWEWVPEVGDHYKLPDGIEDIVLRVSEDGKKVLVDGGDHWLWLGKEVVIPILNWEQIIETLRKVGYRFELWYCTTFQQPAYCKIVKHPIKLTETGVAMQEAVEQAVIALAKEVGK